MSESRLPATADREALSGGGPTGGGAEGWIRRLATDPNSVLERQLCLAVTYFASQLLFLIPDVSVRYPEPVTVGALVMVAATVAAYFMRGPDVRVGLTMLVPLVDLVAVGFLRAGTGGAGSVFTVLMVLPAISLGIEPGRWPLVWGGPVAIGMILLPLHYDPNNLSQGAWVRVFYTPLILGLVALSVNELTRRLRSRVRAVQLLREEQEVLLRQVQEQAAQNEATSQLLRESSTQLRTIIDSVTEQAILGIDPDGRVDVFNTGAERMFRMAGRDVLGRPILSLMKSGHELYGAGLAEILGRVGAGTAEMGEWAHELEDGSRLQLKIAISARRDAAGEVEGFLFVATDVTFDREQARMKDEFVNLISHELRTPLSSILGYSELIVDDEDHPLSEDQRHYMAIVERNAQRLLRLVSDLLFTAQVESGRFAVTEQDVDLAAVVRASVDAAGPAAQHRDVQLVATLPAQPLIVRGDAGRLGQAVDNLISNAIKFSKPQGRVTVGLDRVAGVGDAADGAPAAERAVISVGDTGIGIPADELDRLFARFFRASTATAHAVPGVGLGLTITRAIAVAHHGRIRVASTVGEGTTFALDLPAPDGASGADVRLAAGTAVG